MNQGFVANNLIVCKYFKFLIQKVFLKRILLSSNYVLDVRKNDLTSVIKIPRYTVGHIRQKVKKPLTDYMGYDRIELRYLEFIIQKS